MSNWPQEDYTALGEADDLPEYGNVDYTQQEAYTALESGYPPSNPNSSQGADLNDGEDQQDIYENVAYNANNKPAGARTDQEQTDSSESSGLVQSRLSTFGGGIVKKTKKPSTSIPLESMDGRRSNEDKTPDVLKSLKTKSDQEINPGDLDLKKSGQEGKDYKDKYGKTKVIKDKVVPNMYVDEPMAGTTKPFGGISLLVPTRDAQQTARGRRCIRICSAIWIFLFLASLTTNVVLMVLYFTREEPKEPDTTDGFLHLEKAWMNGSMGRSISSGLLINVASMYNGATCTSSSVYERETYDRRRCQYALDGRVDEDMPGWMPQDNSDIWINVTFNARYTVVAAEFFLNTEQHQQPYGLEISFGSSKSSYPYGLEFHQMDNEEHSNRSILIFDAISTNSVKLQFLVRDKTQKKTFGLQELRIFGYGDPPDGAKCCPSGYVYSPDLRRCYYFSPVQRNKTKTHRDAQAHCLSEGGDLVSINSLAEHDFIRPYLTKKYRVFDLDEFTLHTGNSSTSSFPEFWVGLKRRKDPKDPKDKWFWSDIYTAEYTSWERKQPGTKEGCVQMRAEQNFRWNDKTCNSPVKTLYVCEIHALC